MILVSTLLFTVFDVDFSLTEILKHSTHGVVFIEACFALGTCKGYRLMVDVIKCDTGCSRVGIDKQTTMRNDSFRDCVAIDFRTIRCTCMWFAFLPYLLSFHIVTRCDCSLSVCTISKLLYEDHRCRFRFALVWIYAHRQISRPFRPYKSMSCRIYYHCDRLLFQWGCFNN